MTNPTIIRIFKCFYIPAVMIVSMNSNLFTLAANDTATIDFIQCDNTLLISSDANKDGYIDESEYKNYLETAAPLECDILSAFEARSSSSSTSMARAGPSDPKNGILFDVWDIVTCFCLQFYNSNDPYCCTHSSNYDRQLAIPNEVYYPEPLYTNKICGILNSAIVDECTRLKQVSTPPTDASSSLAAEAEAEAGAEASAAAGAEASSSSSSSSVEVSSSTATSEASSSSAAASISGASSSSSAAASSQQTPGLQDKQSENNAPYAPITTSSTSGQLESLFQSEPATTEVETALSAEQQEEVDKQVQLDFTTASPVLAQPDQENTTDSMTTETNSVVEEEKEPYSAIWTDKNTIISLAALFLLCVIIGITCMMDKKKEAPAEE